MFGHIFKYEFISCLKQKDVLFWLIAFPIILGCFFKAAFAGVYEKTTTFDTISIAVVNEADNSIFTETAKNVKSGDKALFEIQSADLEKAEKLLENENVIGIIDCKDLSVEFASSGIEQTIVRSFISQYKTQEQIITDVVKTDPQKLDTVISAMALPMDANKNIPLHGNTDNMTQYFYNLLAMVALFGSLSGMFVAMNNQGNLSAIGARKCCSPVNKLTSITATLLAHHVVQIVCMVIATAFLAFVLKVDFGDRLPMVFLSAIFGGMVGISFGFFVGSIGSCGQGVKVSICMSCSMISCFFSGLMVGNMKALVHKYVPWFNNVNPAAVISDTFYCLNIYEDYRRFTVKIITMAIMVAAFTLGGYILTRRRKYASL
ncbi:ABC transporter permease [Ruminococcus sp.]|uniref:ABC transporter permease n=1 Tax=Ruminococcus sp. TaxID=41978 RepID=UPI0025D46D1F|nr:ABC transporter permease [Ruminococcus sp.]